MNNFTGILSVFGNQSSLDNDLLLMAGIPDLKQAMAAATQFLTVTRQLSSGQIISVTGVKNAAAQVIVMTDAHAASIQPHEEDLLGVLPDFIESHVKSAAKIGAKKSESKKKSKNENEKNASDTSGQGKAAKSSQQKEAKSSTKKSTSKKAGK